MKNLDKAVTERIDGLSNMYSLSMLKTHLRILCKGYVEEGFDKADILGFIEDITDDIYEEVYHEFTPAPAEVVMPDYKVGSTLTGHNGNFKDTGGDEEEQCIVINVLEEKKTMIVKLDSDHEIICKIEYQEEDNHWEITEIDYETESTHTKSEPRENPFKVGEKVDIVNHDEDAIQEDGCTILEIQNPNTMIVRITSDPSITCKVEWREQHEEWEIVENVHWEEEQEEDKKESIEFTEVDKPINILLNMELDKIDKRLFLTLKNLGIPTLSKGNKTLLLGISIQQYTELANSHNI